MSRLRIGGRRMLGALAGVALGAASLVAFTSGPATASGPGCSGATIEVTTNTDAALRAGFTTANGLAGPQTICIDSGLGTITLGGTELAYTAGTTPGLTVQGNGITISGNTASRVIHNTTVGPLTLNGVAITGGAASQGGGVKADGGSVTLTNSTISGNTATNDGGGLFGNGPVTLTNSTVSGNTATATGIAGLFANGPVTLTNSTVSGNTATAGTAGLFANGSVTLTNSTISANTAAGISNAGGVQANGNVTLTNSSISANTAGNALGGIGGVNANGNVTLTNSTISANTASGVGGIGGVNANGIVTLVYATVVQNSGPAAANVHAVVRLTSFGSVVAQAGGGGANCMATTTTSNGFNFSDDASAGVSCRFNAATDRVGASNNPQLGALANNGGPTHTRLPLSGSPLIDAIPLASCQADGASGITTDQRGIARPQRAGCDIGAVEVQPAAPAAILATPKLTG